MKVGTLTANPVNGITVYVEWNATQSPEQNASIITLKSNVYLGSLPDGFFSDNGIYRQRIAGVVDGGNNVSFVFRVERSNPSEIIWENQTASTTLTHDENGLKTLDLHVLDGGVVEGGSDADITDLDSRGTWELDAINPTAPYVLKGSVSTNKYDSTIGLTLSWTATQSVANNTSTLSWTLKSTGGGTSSWWNTGPVTVKINGTTVLTITSRFKLYGGGAWSKTGSITIAHNSDGTKTFAASISAAIYSSAVNCTGSASFTLDKINRTPGAPTTCSITAGNGSYVGLGDTVTINWSGASGTITGYDIEYSRGNSGWKTYKSVTSTATSGSTTDSFTSTAIGTNGAGCAVQYRVRAKNGTLTSAWKASNILTISGAMDLNVSGTWKTGSVWVNVAGTWKRAKRVWVNVAGTWKQSK